MWASKKQTVKCSENKVSLMSAMLGNKMESKMDSDFEAKP